MDGKSLRAFSADWLTLPQQPLEKIVFLLTIFCRYQQKKIVCGIGAAVETVCIAGVLTGYLGDAENRRRLLLDNKKWKIGETILKFMLVHKIVYYYRANYKFVRIIRSDL
uniref:Uncharacterized protein n=1 Tax=Romanomermis culicivorax TaxID=13658 RepID=A0A915KUD8_ROMCU